VGVRLIDIQAIDIQASGDGVVIPVHVQPRAGRTHVAGRHADALRIRVAAPPVDGKATEAARVTLAAALGVAAAQVALVTGERSRLKRFRVAGLAPDEARIRIGALLAG
jgi:uncharacterized protein